MTGSHNEWTVNSPLPAAIAKITRNTNSDFHEFTRMVTTGKIHLGRANWLSTWNFALMEPEPLMTELSNHPHATMPMRMVRMASKPLLPLMCDHAK